MANLHEIFVLIDSKYSTNNNEALPKMNQSNSPKIASAPLKPDRLELLETNNAQQKMLHAKMMMDPVISLILFNEYIPLIQPKQTLVFDEGEKEKEQLEVDDEVYSEVDAEGICKDFGLFLGKIEEQEKQTSPLSQSETGGLFIRSETASGFENKSESTGGIFLRSQDENSDDWVIA